MSANLFSAEVNWKAFYGTGTADLGNDLGEPAHHSGALLNLMSFFSSYASTEMESVGVDRYVILEDVSITPSEAGHPVVHIPSSFSALAYNPHMPIAFNVIAVDQTGISHGATVWVENDRVEVFLVEGVHAETIYAVIDDDIVPKMVSAWSPQITVAYMDTASLKQAERPESVLWNCYYLFLRMQKSMTADKAVETITLDTHKELRALTAARDRVMRAAGRLIADCIGGVTGRSSAYQHMFGPDADTPVRLTYEMAIKEIRSWVLMCRKRSTISTSELWANLADVLPRKARDSAAVVEGVGNKGKWTGLTEDNKWWTFVPPAGAPDMRFAF